jgi:hypothetical protein
MIIDINKLYATMFTLEGEGIGVIEFITIIE